MSTEPVRPTRLRRRLAVAFVLAVGVTSGALAVGTYLIVEHAQIKDATDRAVSDSILNLRFAARQAATPVALFQAFRDRGDFSTVIVGPGATAQSSAIGPARVPAAVRQLVDAGQVAHEWTAIGSQHYLVVGGILPGSGSSYYFFYDEQQVWTDLQTLRYVLPVAWIAMVVLAGLGGTLLARRTLAPLGQASSAARHLAEGMLDTRLPVSSEDEFGAWAESFNEMASALQAKIEELADARAREQRFTANVAHELLTPLTALVGEARLLESHGEQMPVDARRRLEAELVADVGRLRRLTEDLLEVSRLDADAEPTGQEPVDLGATVRGVARSGGWQDHVAVDPVRIVVQTDPRRLERILTNLIGNAFAHGANAVQVGITRRGASAEVRVADDGPGIPADALPHVFDRFYKADASRGSAGSGLGLAIAWENAQLLGGDISATSPPRGGAVFTLTLPVPKSLAAGEVSETRPVDHPGVAKPASQGGRPCGTP
jgi:signal transduction histidine kinase